MEYAIVILLGISVILLVLSFFGKDRIKKVEEQVEQLSLSVIQETYLLKKKLKVLEEELLTNDLDFNMGTPVSSTSSIPANNRSVLTLFEEGLSYEQIAKKANLPIEEVRLILEHARKMGL
ncbi:hypothetical protein ACLM5H_02135 [Fredinandcohnia humi]